jgi:hypothetical protein
VSVNFYHTTGMGLIKLVALDATCTIFALDLTEQVYCHAALDNFFAHVAVIFCRIHYNG